MAVIAFIGGCCFWFQYRDLDQDDDRLNMLPTGHVIAHAKDVEEAQPVQPAAVEIKEKN